MPSGGCILGICILGVAIRENPDTYAFWGSHLVISILGVAIRENPDTHAFWESHFGYLHSGGCYSGKSRHVYLLGVAFWVFAFWGLRFLKIPTRIPSGGCILDISILGVTIRENPDTYAFWGLHFGYLHSGGCDS